MPSAGLYSRCSEGKRWRKSMFHLIWYVLIGLISGVIAKSVMHVHMTIFWTIVLGIIGSILGGGVSHMFSRPTNERYHPAGLIFSTLGAILVLFICHKLKIHFPQVDPLTTQWVAQLPPAQPNGGRRSRSTLGPEPAIMPVCAFAPAAEPGMLSLRWKDACLCDKCRSAQACHPTPPGKRR